MRTGPGWPRIPEGWSLRNLQRLAPQSLETVALKQGIRAAAPQLAQVLATREGLWLGSHFMFDDVWLDLLVLAGRDKGQTPAAWRAGVPYGQARGVGPKKSAAATRRRAR